MATIKRALISVSDKSGILELAIVLTKLNVEILSTGGTAVSYTHLDVYKRQAYALPKPQQTK